MCAQVVSADSRVKDSETLIVGLYVFEFLYNSAQYTSLSTPEHFSYRFSVQLVYLDIMLHVRSKCPFPKKFSVLLENKCCPPFICTVAL